MSVPEYEAHVLSCEFDEARDVEDLETSDVESRYRDYFCENFARLAPMAWERLLSIEPTIDQLMETPEASFGDVWKILIDGCSVWARRFRVDAPWVRDAAALTLVGRWILRREGDSRLEDLDTLDWNIRVTVTNDPEARWPYSFTRGVNAVTLEVAFRLANFETTWNPLSPETKAQFRARTIAEFTERLDQSLKTSGVPRGSVRIDREAIDLFIQVQPGGIPKARFEAEGIMSRQKVQGAVKRAAARLRIPYS